MKNSFRKKETFREIYLNKDFWCYIKYFLTVAVGEYTQYVGVDIKTVICGVYGDTNIISAWVSLQSIMSINYMYGLGFANSIRTYVGNSIGKQEFKKAKKIALWGVIVNFGMCVIPWIFGGIFSYNIAHFFTDIPATLNVLQTYVIFYSVAGPIDA